MIPTILVTILCMCGVNGPVNGPYAPAVRGEQVQLEPPPPPPPPAVPGWSTASSNGTCTGLIPLLQFYSPGWDVNRMARIAYRESRCQPDASNSCCSGVLQMHRMHIPNAGCGVYSRGDYYDPAKNICAAADLWEASGYGAWSTS